MKQQWYATNAFKLSMGTLGIVATLCLLFVANNRLGEATTATEAVSVGERQVIRMSVERTGYKPSTFAVKEGVPVTFIIDGKEITGCSQYIVSQQLGFNRKLQSGENIIELPALKKGTYAFSCQMNMLRGSIAVVASDEPLTPPPPPAQAGGCGCKH